MRGSVLAYQQRRTRKSNAGQTDTPPRHPNRKICASWASSRTCPNFEFMKRCCFDHPPEDLLKKFADKTDVQSTQSTEDTLWGGSPMDQMSESIFSGSPECVMGIFFESHVETKLSAASSQHSSQAGILPINRAISRDLCALFDLPEQPKYLRNAKHPAHILNRMRACAVTKNS